MPDEVLQPGAESMNGEGVINTSAENIPTPEHEPLPEAKPDRAGEQYGKILSQVQPGSAATTTDDEVESDVTIVGALEEAEKQVHALIELAQVKGVAHAVRVAKRMNDLYVLDTMHDELADKLYDGLVAKGLITKE